MKYKTFVSGVINQNQSYTGKELYDMIMARFKRESLNSEQAQELYDKYFSPNGTYKVSMNHKYFVRKNRGDIYLIRDKE